MADGLRTGGTSPRLLVHPRALGAPARPEPGEARVDRNLWKHSTSTVGLVTARHGDLVNGMAAEWTYFVAKEPPHIAVCVHDDNLTQQLVLEHGEFGVTLCSADQAPIADFVGSVSGRDVDKTSSELVELVAPVATSTPCVAGGVLRAECTVRHVLELPNYRLIVGAVVHAEVDEDASRTPLVKHGGMYHLGEPIVRDRIVAAAELVAGDGDRPEVLVCATGPFAAAGADGADVALVADDGRSWSLGRVALDEYGDVFAQAQLPADVDPAAVPPARVVVSAPGLVAGTARLTAARVAAEVAV
jgi:flavin reductase (DIM6/NTAB) family NADH-FMN oxidoreductase RutF